MSANLFRILIANLRCSGRVLGKSMVVGSFVSYLFLCCSGSYAASNSENKDQDAFKPSTMENNVGQGEDKAFEPEIYADPSDSAVQNAVSFDGAKILCGLGMSMQKYAASVKGCENFTSNSTNAFNVIVGMEYAKSFKKGLLMSGGARIKITKKQKKELDWNSMNAGYNELKKVTGVRSGYMENSAMIPVALVKCGYALKEYKSVAFATLEIAWMSVSYSYTLDGEKVCNVSTKSMVPQIGLGIERKWNKKIGLLAEVSFPIKRMCKTTADGVEHRIRVGQTSLKLLMSISLQNVPAGLDAKL
ncbi:MAG: hypothetical protein LBT70_02880 [Holosporaceae bacterium]|nr:hypothetical protein [Holosporaceae bacterium]